MVFENSLDFARKLDNKDVLNKFRSEFIIPPHKDKNAIYFLGNSLGLQPRQTATYIQEVLNGWGSLGVEGFFIGYQPWLEYHSQLTGPLAEIVGALSHEIVVMNQLTVNLHLMMVSFYQPKDKRKKILCEAKAFPSDQYMLETHLKSLGLNPDDILIEVKPRDGEVIIREEDILDAIERNSEEIALVFWGGVNYYTGQVFNMELITTRGQQAGAKVGFDLAHAAGNIHLQLHGWNVDFACWCSYKYLNSGPGSIGGVYIHERHHSDPLLQRFAGWWGYKKETRFQMKQGFMPIASAEGWQLSTPSIILYAAHKASLEIFSRAGILNIIAKGNHLNNYLLFLLDEINRFEEPVIRIITPAEKGCQTSMLMLKYGKEIFNMLMQNGVFADWREPDVIRVAPVPLYNTYEEVWQFAKIIEQAIIKINA